MQITIRTATAPPSATRAAGIQQAIDELAEIEPYVERALAALDEAGAYGHFRELANISHRIEQFRYAMGARR